MRLGKVQSQLLTRDFTPKKILIILNQNVYQNGTYFIDTTQNLNMVGKEYDVVTTYKSASQYEYSQIQDENQYYIINSDFTKLINKVYRKSSLSVHFLF